MFNLDQAIAEWRRRMADGGIRNPQVLDELESHLREDVEQQMQSGSNLEQAFAAAVERIGPARSLTPEFAKTASSRSPRRKLAFVGCISSAAFILLANAWAFIGDDVSPVEKTLGLIMASFIALYLGSIPFLHRWLPDLHNRKFAAAAQGLNVLMCLWIVTNLVCALDFVHFKISSTSVQMVSWTFCAVYAITLGSYIVYRRDHDPFDVLTLAPWAPTARESLELAREEASRFNHDFIGTEHVLLGLLQLEHDAVRVALNKMGVDHQAVRNEIEKVVGPGQARPAAAAIPYTPRARNAFRLAVREAKALKHVQVRPAHLFLGLLCEGSGVAAVVLEKLGVRIDRARETIRRELE